jgi:hypothetical protein
MRITLFLLVAVYWSLVVIAAPVPKGETIPPPPHPDETLFPGKRSDHGVVLAVSDRKVTLQQVPRLIRSFDQSLGKMVEKEEVVDPKPCTYYIHPVMKDGGLADEMYDHTGYAVKDLNVGDLVDLYHELGEGQSRWLIAIRVYDRDKKGPPPPSRTYDQWREIKWVRAFAREQRLKAKEAAEKK